MPKDSPASRQITPLAAGAMDKDFYLRYLAAKKSIDDRALNRYVWDSLCQALPKTMAGEALRIVEIGAGIGTMIERVVDWGLVTGQASYLASDRAADHIQAARPRLTKWAKDRGHALSWPGQASGRLRTAGAEMLLELEVASLEELAGRPETQVPFHLLIAHAVLDLVDFAELLPKLFRRLTKNGLAYLTCNFDGETVFLPEYQGHEEKEIIRRYHASMEARLTGSSRSGRRLLTFLGRPGLEVLAAGSSDWIIPPGADRYSSDEAFFLHAIIETVERELTKNGSQSPVGLSAWARSRHRQVESGELIFMARHLDLLVRLAESGP